MKSTEENMILCQQLIAERHQSGKTVAEWCNEKQLSKHKYYYWNSTLNKRQTSADEVKFVEITHIDSHSDNRTLDNVKHKGFKIVY